MSMSIQELMEQAKLCGFTAAGALDPGTINLRDEVRAMCAEQKCHAYGHIWTCPPACGTLDECRARIAKYSAGIIVQTTGQLEDSMDYETMMDTSDVHKENFRKFVEVVRQEYPDALCLSAGGCTVCSKCNYPEPCRFPEKAFSSMEGYGMVVSDVCSDNNIPYYYGQNTITFVGCYLLY